MAEEKDPTLRRIEEGDPTQETSVLKIPPKTEVDAHIQFTRDSLPPPPDAKQRLVPDNLYYEWISRLSDEEKIHYDRIGMLFRELEILLSTSEDRDEAHEEMREHHYGNEKYFTAPFEEASSQKQLSFSYVEALLREIQKESEIFLEKQPAHKLGNIYRELNALRHAESVNHADQGMLDQAFLKTVQFLVKTGDINREYSELFHSRTSKERIDAIRNHIKESYKLTDDELPLMEEFLKEIFSAYAAVSRDESFPVDSIDALLDKLKKVDGVSRFLAFGKEIFGLDEIYKISENFDAIATGLAKAKINDNQDDQEDSQTQEWREKIRDLKNLFVDNGTDVLASHNRKLTRGRLGKCQKLNEILDNIKNEEVRERLRETIEVIGKLLCYLDHIISLREITEVNGHKQTTYPKNLLPLACHVWDHVEKLIPALTFIAQKSYGYTADIPNGIPTTFPYESAVQDKSQSEFRLPVVTEADPELAERLDFIKRIIGNDIGEAKNALKKTEVINSQVHEESEPLPLLVEQETLSVAEFEEFILKSQRFLMIAVTSIANAVNNERHARRDIVDGYEECEDQAAGLRLEIEELNKVSQKIHSQIGELRAQANVTATWNSDAVDQKAQSILISLAKEISKFRSQQDHAIVHDHSFATMQGSGYQAIIEFGDILNDYILSEEFNHLKRKTPALFGLTQKIYRLGARVSKSLQSPTTKTWLKENKERPDVRAICEWMHAHKAMSASRNRVKEEQQLNGGADQSLTSKFTDKFTHLLSIMEKVTATEDNPAAETENPALDDAAIDYNSQRKVEEAFKELRHLLEVHPEISGLSDTIFDDNFFKFQRLMTRFDNYLKQFDFLAETSVDLFILSEHDHRQATILTQNIKKIVESLDRLSEEEIGQDQFLQLIADCKNRLRHFKSHNSLETIARSLDCTIDRVELHIRYSEAPNQHNNMASIKEELETSRAYFISALCL